MTQTQYCTVADVKAELGTPNSSDDTLIGRYIDRACAGIERETGLSWAATTWTATVFRPADVVWLREGVIRVRVGVPNITAISAFAYRLGAPWTAWSAVDSTLLDVQTADHVWWVTAYLGPYSLIPYAAVGTTWSANLPLWAQVSGTAGYAVGSYPNDLVQLATAWAAYLYRSKDVPNEKTANPMLGTVTIPAAFPVKLTPMLDRWRNCEVA